MIRDAETQTLLEDTIRRFVRETLVPREAEVDETDAIPADLVETMREIGLFGLTIPEAYGGLGLTMEEEVRIAFELGQTSPAFRSFIGTNNGIGSIGILLDGTDAQKSHYLPKLAVGELIGSFCLTEPDAGSDAASLKTTAKQDGDAYVLNGTKRYITNAPEAGIYTVMARTSDAKGASGISAFIVERGTPGLSIGKADKKMGQRGAHTADVIFENCRVPMANLIGGAEGVGFKMAMKVLDKGRIHIAAIAIGAAKRMLRDALAYAMERKQFGQPIAEFQLVQAMLADSKAEIYAAECMVLDAARRRDEGRDVSVEASCAKYFATEMCGRVADRAVQVHGGAGYIAEYGISGFIAMCACSGCMRGRRRYSRSSSRGG
ncbi:Butyryl-CoA dehydrogenase [Candidatus Burkholderia verschuerenii]|uniref:Butyryl-CoA dehydrogenase n=1 Tax=Candidatus Burkholderia verschuerenii TaxID=242163 RepID=A0A0L0MCN5_9BURK|nr:Butyryl-CoA dehydrogenase [Candidatus Burkholderia verschuerenii]